MFKRSIILAALFLGVVALLLPASSQANVWLDEDFEDATNFVQLDGNSFGDRGWDSESFNALNNTVTATTGYNLDGTRTTAKAFQGDASWTLSAGDDITVGPDYQDPGNGNTQLFQFAVNVDPIPAAGLVAEFRWDHNANTTVAGNEYSFYVRLESDGDEVEIIGGEDLFNATADEAVIGTLETADDWAFISVHVQKDPGTVPDDREETMPGLPEIFETGIPQGVHFYNSSTVAAHSIDMAGDGTEYQAGGWSFSVSSGTVYLDEMYWEGAKEDQASDSNPRPFDSEADEPTSVTEWQLH